MDPIRILHWEMLGFFWLLAVTLAYRMLTREINLRGLLTDSIHRERVSPERVQLLVASLTISAQYAGAVLRAKGGTMPDVGTTSLVLLGASSGLYGAVKAFKMLQKR
jgi:hypothetical protein